MSLVPKISFGNVEREDYDCVALESSLSSLLGFLDPISREPAGAMDSSKLHDSIGEAQAAAGREAAGADQPPRAAEAATQQGPRRPASPSETAQQNSSSAGGAEPASGGEGPKSQVTGQEVGRNVDSITDDEPQRPAQPAQQQQLPPAPLSSDDALAAAAAKRPSTSSCSDAGSSSGTAINFAPDLGLKVADVCRATVRDMLKEVLLETLPMQDAVEVLFKMDSHSGWAHIRGCATDLITTESRLDAGASSTAVAAAAALPPLYRGSASLPSTPAKVSPNHGGMPLTAPPPLLPRPLQLQQLSKVCDATTAAIAAATAPPPPPPPPPLTPARSAPGAIPAPVFGLGGGVRSPTPAEAADGALGSSGASTPLASGPGGLGGSAAEGDTVIGGPPSALLVRLLQQHPDLGECLQQNPQLLSSILSVTGGTGGAMPSPYGDGAGAGYGYGGLLAGLHHPQMGSPLHSPPAMVSPAACHGATASIWGAPLLTHGSPRHSAGPFGSPQSHSAVGAGPSGLEAFHALMGGSASSASAAPPLQGSDPMAAGYSCKTFEELSPAVREKIQIVLDTCGPHIRAEHFDAGVRHWLLQLQLLFGELCAVSALHAIETAANLEGVRRMKAFITTRLIDHYEQMVWAQDPQGYALRKLTPDLIAVLEDLVHSDKGLRWTHFDPKVLDTIREIRAPDAVRTRLSKLCAQELNGVQNVPAYLYTLLSKRGKTAKQAAAQKEMHELALRLTAAQGGLSGGGGGGYDGLPGTGRGMGGALGGLAAMGLGGAGGGGTPYGGYGGYGGPGALYGGGYDGAGAGGLGGGYGGLFGDMGMRP